MNIAYIIPSLANRGPVLVVKDLVGQMIKYGHKCSVFYFDEIKEIELDCPVYRIRLWQKIDFKKFDIIHSHGLRPDCYVFCHKPFRTKACFVTTIHNYVLRDFSYQYNNLIAYICGNLWMALLVRHDKLITLSQDAVKYYRRWFPMCKLTYAYNTRSVSEKEILSSWEEKELIEFKQDAVLIGVNALITSRKGIDQLIRALPELPSYKLFIAGDGKKKDKLIQLAIQCKVENRILFAGYRKDAYRYLSFYDIYAMPSRSEGFSLSLLEAATHKIPTVCSDIEVFREQFTSEEVAFFDLEDIPSLVEAIKFATANSVLGYQMYKRYLNCYCPEKFYEKYISIYHSLL